jgi:hypothetical protein
MECIPRTTELALLIYNCYLAKFGQLPDDAFQGVGLVLPGE